MFVCLYAVLCACVQCVCMCACVRAFECVFDVCARACVLLNSAVQSSGVCLYAALCACVELFVPIYI